MQNTKLLSTISLVLICTTGYSQKDLPIITACEAKIYYSEVVPDQILIPELKTFHFEAASNPDGVAWKWYIGDSLFSTSRITNHTLPLIWSDKYQNYGSEICLTVTTADSCTVKKCQFVPWASPNDVCSSTYTAIRIDSSLDKTHATIQFNGSSQDTITKWSWNFGDGVASSEMNPIHIFNMPDVKCLGSKCIVQYKVCLKTINNKGCQHEDCQIIQPSMLPQHNCQAKFGYILEKSNPPIYDFMNESIWKGDKAYWDFGDGTFSYENNPKHIFTKMTMKDVGMYSNPIYQYAYDVCLTVSDSSGCYNSYCQTIFQKPDTNNVFCNKFIKLTTTTTLNNIKCDGAATASLVDIKGNLVAIKNYYWFNGDTTKSMYNLCNNTTYSISITDEKGCVIVGSFNMSDNSNPTTYPGNWGYELKDSSYIFRYLTTLSSISVEWKFSDNTTEIGMYVDHSFKSSGNNWADLYVKDYKGNVIYNERILLSNTTTEIPPILKNESIYLYPNPVKDIITVKLIGVKDQHLLFEISDILGKIVYSERLLSINEKTTINTSKLKPGLYVCRIKSKSNILYTAKIIK